jgi:O-methyltransferase involved in polyketide biosynthesis
MSYAKFVKAELAAAIARGVRQCVVIGSQPALRDAFTQSPNSSGCRVFAVDEDAVSGPSTTVVSTRFASDTLAASLEKSDFDKRNASLFLWLGGAGYRALDAVIASLAFIATLPKGTGVVLDYVVERTSLGALTETALDALASRIALSSGQVKYLIQPLAVTAMLNGLGFQQIVDLAEDGPAVRNGHLVSAVV